MSYTYNKFKDTKIYGNFQNSDNPSGGNQANAIFDRNLTVSGIINASKIYNNSGNIDLSGNNITFNGININSYETIIDVSNNYLKITDASNNYLTIASANSIINNYLKITDASNNYLKITDASNNYLKISNASSNYLKISDAASTYQTIANMSSFLHDGGSVKFGAINNATMSLLSSFPTTAVNNAGLELYWNQSGTQGETDFICNGGASTGGLSIWGTGNYTTPTQIANFYSNSIQFFSNPSFPTNNTIGNYGATTSYVNSQLANYQTIANMSNYIQQGGTINLNITAKMYFPSFFPPINSGNTGVGWYYNKSSSFETDLICYSNASSGGGLSIWNIDNTSQTNIANFLKSSINFSVTPTFPTVTATDNSNKGATTSFVSNALTNYANLSSNNTFTGNNIFNSTSLTIGTTAKLVIQNLAVQNSNPYIYLSASGSYRGIFIDALSTTLSLGGAQITLEGDILTNNNLNFYISTVVQNATDPQIIWYDSNAQSVSTITTNTSNKSMNFSFSSSVVSNSFVFSGGNINSTAQQQTWFLSANTAGNSYTLAGYNIGSSYNSTSSRWDKVTVYGNANASNWDSTNGIFTASVSGTYYFQLCVFTNGTGTYGRWLKARGTCIPVGQYLSFNESYLINEGAFTVTVMYYMAAGQTFYFYCENTSPVFYYGDGHTTCQIIKIF